MPGLTAGYLAVALYLVAMQLTSVWPLVAVMLVISFTIDFGLGASWASYQDIAGRHVATVLGIGNMCGNLGAAGFGYYIGVLAKADQWNTVFLIAGLAMAVYGAGRLDSHGVFHGTLYLRGGGDPTFGDAAFIRHNYGAGTTLYWVDPELDLTFIGLCTGVMTSGDNIERWQKLSDIAVSAVR